jgi:hypothetical protein
MKLPEMFRDALWSFDFASLDSAGVISIAQRKLGSVFDPRLFLEQLVYFDDRAEGTLECGCEDAAFRP